MATHPDGMLADLPEDVTSAPRTINPIHNAMSQRIWAKTSQPKLPQYAPSLHSVGPTPTSIPSRDGNLESRGFPRPRSVADTIERRFQMSSAAPRTRAVLREPVTEVRMNAPVMLSDLRRAQSLSDYRAVFDKSQ